MSSDTPHRSSRTKGSSKRMVKREPQSSNAPGKKSVSSLSVQAPSSRIDSYSYQSIDEEKLQVTVGTGYGYGHYDMEQYEARPSTNASEHGHYSSQQFGAQIRIGASDYGHCIGQQYTAQVAAGAVSLSIDVSPALQLSLADQHGSLKAREPAYSTVKEGELFLGDSQSQDFGDVEETSQFEPINHGPNHGASQARDSFSIDLPSFLAPLYSFEYDDVEDWSHSFSNHSFEYDSFWGPSFEYDYSDFSRTSPSFTPLPPYLPNSGILTTTSVPIPKGGPLFQTLELGNSQEPVHPQSPSFLPINRNLEASLGVICSLPAQRQSSLADNGQNQISQNLVHNDGTTGSGEASSSSYSVHQPNINAPHSAALEPVNPTQESPVSDGSLEAPRNPKWPRRRRKCLHFSCDFCSETFTRRCDLKTVTMGCTPPYGFWDEAMIIIAVKIHPEGIYTYVSGLVSEAITRILSDPGLPTTSPPATSSFWLSPLHPAFSTSPPPPPPDAEIVIIGSGITGTSIARHLIRYHRSSLSKQDKKQNPIVVLDARDVCSGATGRNGGHVNEVGWEEYGDLVTRYGREEAKKITRFRMSHVDELMRVVSEEGLGEECGMRVVESTCVFFGEKGWERGKAAVEGFKEDFGDEVDACKLVEGAEEMQAMGLPGAYGIIKGKAGAMWPYRFVSGVLANLKRDDEGLHVCPHTPATGISVSGDGLFVVSTPGGDIRAKHVVHATNAHVGHLVPGFRGRVYPLRGQMSAQVPPKWFSHQGGERSWSFEYDVGFDYLTQLPKGETGGDEWCGGGEMMFGGGFVQAGFSGLVEMGVASDSELNENVAVHLTHGLGKAFENVGEDRFEVKSMWTGNMGFSVDMLPWVGKLPGSLTERESGQGAEWVSVGYSGEGMVNAWLCGKALAMMILGERESIKEWFPQQMGISEERIRESVLERCVDIGTMGRSDLNMA
ncbi:hypothetical protein V500_06694 [Pseudogymnoascus sp. VKM F-4518 (FW-2643)]|nr:hypothetical protein V500_06694 [Pseudogymnoascus sp. VKM F-4518 (FW-2643)]